MLTRYKDRGVQRKSGGVEHSRGEGRIWKKNFFGVKSLTIIDVSLINITILLVIDAEARALSQGDAHKLQLSTQLSLRPFQTGSLRRPPTTANKSQKPAVSPIKPVLPPSKPKMVRQSRGGSAAGPRSCSESVRAGSLTRLRSSVRNEPVTSFTSRFLEPAALTGAHGHQRTRQGHGHNFLHQLL